MNVWSYWAGPMPDWIATCIASMRHYCKQSQFTLLTPDNWREYAPDLNERWATLTPGVGTDCLRAALLAKHGGLWLDADTVLVSDPDVLHSQYHTTRQFLYSTWTKGPRRAIAGYVYSPKGNPVARHWLECVEAGLDYAEDIGWGTLGEKTLTPIVHCYTKRYVWEMARETFMPVDVDSSVRRYFQRSGWNDFVTQDTVGFGLNYSWMVANMQPELLYDGPLMLQRLLCHAKQTCQS